MTSQRAALSVLILLLLLTVAAYWWLGRHPQPAPLPLIYPDGMMVDKALVDKSNELLQQADAILVAAPEAEEGNFATITTPKGAYSLEAREGSGWVYKNPAEVELTQPGKNDYLEVPEEELRQHSLHDHD